MKFTDKKNQIGLAKQATRKYKADHVVYEYNKGLFRFKLDDGKTKGEVISFKEIEKQDKNTRKSEVKEVAEKVDIQNKPKKDKPIS